MTLPELTTINVTLYAPDASGQGHAEIAKGSFDIDRDEPLTRADAVEMLGLFIVNMRDRYDWQEYDRDQLVASAEFPGLGTVNADGLGREQKAE